MSTATASSPSPASTVKPVPDGMHTATPHLVCANTGAAIDFYVKAFNAVEMIRMPMPDGKIIHACIRIGDSMIMLVDEFPDMGSLSPTTLKGTPVTIHLQVENADALADQAVKAGAKLLMPVQEMFWGDRYGMVQDPFGHQWSIATHVKDVSPEDAMKAAQNMGGCGSPN